MPGLYMQCQCGAPVARKRWRRGARTCVPCGLAKAVIHNRELHEKNGAAYNIWRARMLKLLQDNNFDYGGSENGNPG